jgi:dolichyl-phosphate-mannose-protein mannosyltransferase
MWDSEQLTYSGNQHDYNLRKRRLKVYLPSDNNTDDGHHDSNKPSDGVDVAQNRSTDSVYWIVVTIASLITRCLFIDSSNIVVWDEAHFGKFANHYIKRTFYFDVHPPLGKMLIAFSAWCWGYDGSFAFQSGSTYDDNVPITRMRLFCAILGSLSIPFVYGICRNLKYGRKLSLVIASCVLFDNAILIISKFVLLDPILLCFTTLSVYTITRFENELYRPFSPNWFGWLAATGVSLGLVIAVKWVGLFTYAFVGWLTICQLWNMLPNLRKNRWDFIKHVTYRAIFLIGFPLALYMAFFYLHFAILHRSGSGDAVMSSRFQATLLDSTIKQGFPRVIVDKSYVTLRNHRYGGGLLHSHAQTYPLGSKQGQVTLYHHRDENNVWKIASPWKNDSSNVLSSQWIQNGDVVRLSHNATRRNLHSHAIPAPMSVYQMEVSAYGNETMGDNKDHWIVEKISGPSDDIVRLDTTFRLRHQVLGCYLASSGSRLPEWGFSQLEIVCTNMPNRYAEWNIEENIVFDGGNDDPITEEIESKTMTNRLMDFFTDFVDLNVAMWTANNALIPKPGKKDMLFSRPIQWPFLRAGIRMCNWKDETVKYYMLGNPIVWWLSSAAILWWTIDWIKFRIKEKIVGFVTKEETDDVTLGSNWVMGWLLHYLPFQIMGRVTYLHHYFPALLFAIFVLGHQMKRFAQRDRVLMAMSVAVIASFSYMAPMSYGFVGNANSIMTGRQWLKDWNVIDD